MSLNFSFNYTSATENASQGTPENSIGGYISTNGIYAETTISSRIDVSQTTIPVTVLPSSSAGLVHIETEIMNYTGIDSINSKLTGVTRGIVPKNSYPHGITPNNAGIKYLVTSSLFSSKFNENLKQYRCVVVKNTSTTVVDDVRLFLVKNPDDDVQIDIGIEVPFHDYHTAIATESPTDMMITDSSLAGLYADNFFINSLLRITSGIHINKTTTIASYDGSEGTFILSNELGPISDGDTFEIEPTPSQRVTNHLTKPGLNGLFFGFSSEGGSLNLGNGSIRENEDTFNKNDLFYIWIERNFAVNVKSSNDTGSIILLRYKLASS